MESSDSQTTGAEPHRAIAAVEVREWSMEGQQGSIFSDVSLDIPEGGLAIVRGTSGSGKTALLLSIAGRMRVSSGEGWIGDLNLRRQGRAVRNRVALGYVAGLTDLEGNFTVAQHIAERLIMLQPWYKPWVSKSSLRGSIEVIRDAFVAASEFIDGQPDGTFSSGDAAQADFLIDTEGKTYVSELSDLQRFFLEFGLASLSRPSVIVIDNIDFLRERTDRARAWAGLLICQQLRHNRDPEYPLTVIVSCEDASDSDAALKAFATEGSPISVSELVLARRDMSRH